ncbi:undecaprenyl-diphosphatase [Micromonospora viridifaciens]|uniref:Undecaprenyl-diphosphatase n=1 Tax=Micromonospora viridifaciens TaxID=1881 RepID=A0A1C4Z0E9_MICVI|nr:phosphatase PAP2 family protein [Micromonospora viridifaciens]SCF26438.1 undecaprenyl-diphosphatase [Micromonospora viridifaciens]
MTLIYASGVVAVLGPLLVVPWLVVRWAPAGAGSRGAGRLRGAVAGLTAAIGRLGAAAVVLLAGSAAVVAVCWPLGEALSRLEPHVDRPVFAYVHARRVEGWAQVNSLVTGIGDRYPLMWVTAVAALALALAWRRRRWWLPLVALPLQFVVEQYTQEILSRLVDRGHPPTDLGTYPSGGCARLLMTFGVAVTLFVLVRPISRRVLAALVTAPAVLATVEGYTRVYAEKHWLTDVVGGLIFGTLLTGVAVFALVVADGRVPPPLDPPAAPSRRHGYAMTGT